MRCTGLLTPGNALMGTLAALLAACSSTPPQAAASGGGYCRLEPFGRSDGTDRRAPTTLAERGIGGTETPVTPVALPAESETRRPGPAPDDNRGIGGTGIIGVITGFGSVCVDGLEVAYRRDMPIDADGVRVPAATLRVGQVAVIDATGPSTALQARSLAIRHEVSGPVESVSDDGTVLVVAGQPVSLAATLRDADGTGTLVIAQQQPVTAGGTVQDARSVKPGEWVAVSGLRDPQDRIAAARIDRRPPGEVLVRGRLLRGTGGWRLGRLVVQPPPGGLPAPGTWVTASGRLRDGALAADRILPDPLAANPVQGFAPEIGRVFVQAYPEVLGRAVQLGPAGIVDHPGPEVFELRRAPDGKVQAIARRDVPFNDTGLRFGPAPVPDTPQRRGSGPCRILHSTPGLPGLHYYEGEADLPRSDRVGRCIDAGE